MKAPETHIAICGHVKHGKSTLAGRLMYEFNAISDTDLNDLRKEVSSLADSIQKDYNEFSLMFLKRRSSTFIKKSGKESDPSRTPFPERGKVVLKDGYTLTLVDTPGHESYLDNTIYGVYLADLAVLVVEATTGVGYGTIRIARILSSFAVPIIAVFVTKMDLIGYSERRFRAVEEEIEQFVTPLFKYQDKYPPPIIPIAALPGVGFGKQIEDLQWFSGINALKAIQESQITHAPEMVKGVRFIVEGGKEVYSPPGVGTVLVGMLETGKIHIGDQLVIEPASTNEGKAIIVRIRSLQWARSIAEKKGKSAEFISARAIAAIATNSLTVLEAEEYLKHGGVLGELSDRPSVAREIEAEIVFFEQGTVYRGKEYVILTNASSITARITSIERKPGAMGDLDRLAANKSKSRYDLSEDVYETREMDVVRAVLIFTQPICIESSMEYQRLTKFILREHNRVVACGRCLNISLTSSTT